jgi:integrase
MEFINDKGGVANVHKELIQAAVANIRTEIIRRLRAVVVLDSDESKIVVKAYENYHAPLALAHERYQSTTHLNNSSEPPPIKSLKEYKLERLECGERGISNDGDSMLSYALQFREMNEQFDDNSDWRSIKYSGDYFQAEEELEHFLSSARVIREAIANNDNQRAAKVFEDITGKVIVDNTEATTESLNSFEQYMDMFLNAGETGTLPDKRNKWSEKILKGYERMAALFKYLFRNKTLDEVTSRVLDESFSNVILNLPKSNMRPYNKMSLLDRVHNTEEGRVDEEHIISTKSALEYKKFLQSFYAYLYSNHIIQASPIDKMRTKFPKGKNKRGAFDDDTVRKIIQVCRKQTEANKKWPVLIMAFSGMRNGEVMQLRKVDIKKSAESSTYYMNITSDAGSTKTIAANRLVPIHDELINMGFLDYVNSSKDGKIFDKTSKYLTNFYSSTLRSECEIPNSNELSENLNLYSLRHTVITKLQGENVNQAITQQLVGHSKQASVTSGYTLAKHLNTVLYRLLLVRIDVFS